MSVVKVAKAALQWNEAGMRPDIATALRSVLDACERVERIHQPRHGVRLIFASDDYEAEREPVGEAPYVVCVGCSAVWPCRTMRALGHQPSEPEPS